MTPGLGNRKRKAPVPCDFFILFESWRGHSENLLVLPNLEGPLCDAKHFAHLPFILFVGAQSGITSSIWRMRKQKVMQIGQDPTPGC